MFKNTKVISILFSSYLCMFLLAPVIVGAVTTTDAAGCTTESGMTSCKLDNPLQQDPTEVTTIIGNALNGVIALVGAITLAMFVYGGFNWLISAGNPERIKTGRDTMIWAAIGLVAVFAAYGTLNFVFKELFSG